MPQPRPDEEAPDGLLEAAHAVSMTADAPEVPLPPVGVKRQSVLEQATPRRMLARLGASYGYTLTSCATNLISIPLFLHFLGRHEFGTWVVASAVAGYSMLLQVGIAQATANRFAESLHRGADRDAVATLATGFWATGRIAFSLGALAFLLYFLVKIFTPGLPTVALCILATGAFLIDLPFVVIGASARTSGHVTAYQIAASVTLVSRVVTGALVLMAGAGATGLILSQATVGLAFHMMMWWCLRSTLPSVSIRPALSDRNLRRSMRGHSAGFFAIELGGTITLALDSVVIAVTLGSSAVTPYAIAQRLLTLAAGVVGSTAAAFYPDLIGVRAGASIERLRRVFRKMSLASAVMGGACVAAAVVCARPAIAHWVGAANLLDSSTFLCLLGVMVITVFLYPYAQLLMATSQHRRYAAMAIVDAIINLSLSVVLVRHVGVVGVAGATLVGRLVATGPVMLRDTARVLQTSVRETLYACVVVVVPVLVSVGAMISLQHAIGTGRQALLATALAGLGLYAALLIGTLVVRMGPRTSLELLRHRMGAVAAERSR